MAFFSIPTTDYGNAKQLCTRSLLVVLGFFGCVGNPSWDDGARSSSRQLLRQVDDVFFGSCLFRVPTSRTKRFFQKPMRKILNCKTPSLSVIETPFHKKINTRTYDTSSYGMVVVRETICQHTTPSKHAFPTTRNIIHNKNGSLIRFIIWILEMARL